VTQGTSLFAECAVYGATCSWLQMCAMSFLPQLRSEHCCSSTTRHSSQSHPPTSKIHRRLQLPLLTHVLTHILLTEAVWTPWIGISVTQLFSDVISCLASSCQDINNTRATWPPCVERGAERAMLRLAAETAATAATALAAFSFCHACVKHGVVLWPRAPDAQGATRLIP